MKRTTVLLDDATFEQLKASARRRGKTVTHELREAVDRFLLSQETDSAQRLIALAAANDSFEGLRHGPHPDVDSEVARKQATKSLYEDMTDGAPDP